jgi:hypothetical protein
MYAALVEVRDHALWINHVRPAGPLSDLLMSLEPGADISLEVNGHVGLWRKMAAGRDGRPTHGLKPLDGAQAAWHSLQSSRGMKVSIDLMQPGPITPAEPVIVSAGGSAPMVVGPPLAGGRRLKLPEPVSAIYRAVGELEAAYPGRKFTPDGHLVGSIGEVLAAEALGLTLHPASFPGHDAIDQAGRQVQIKLTRGTAVSMYATCERLVVLRIVSDEVAEIVFDGEGEAAWAAAGPIQKNGQRVVSLAKLARLSS